ncbi:MAG TPA: PorV/PorQ family protein, partial [Bacteroidota bacterium]|nr:PorV/PorQ family protein [Bacteroidota bacterium]
MKESVQMLRALILTTVIVLIAVSTGQAGDRSGTVSEEFLKLPLSARAVGMGGAQVAIAEGVSSIGFNPAGMMSVDNYAFGATYTAWFAQIQHSYMGVVKNFPGFGALGVSVTILTTDDMQETTPAYPEGDGLNFRASDYAFSVAYARQVSDKFMVGVNAKIIQSYLYNTQIGASSFAFDVGTLYDIPRLRSRLGVALTNIGKDVQFLNEPYSLPTALRFGILVDVLNQGSHQLKTTLQISRNNDTEEQYNVGGEYVLSGIFSLRAGYKFAYDNEDITAGF